MVGTAAPYQSRDKPQTPWQDVRSTSPMSALKGSAGGGGGGQNVEYATDPQGPRWAVTDATTISETNPLMINKGIRQASYRGAVRSRVRAADWFRRMLREGLRSVFSSSLRARASTTCTLNIHEVAATPHLDTHFAPLAPTEPALQFTSEPEIPSGEGRRYKKDSSTKGVSF